MIPFTVVPVTRQIVFDDVATTAVTLAPEGTVILPKTAIDFSVAAFFLLTIGTTLGATVVVVAATVVVVGATVVVVGATVVVVAMAATVVLVELVEDEDGDVAVTS